MQVGSAICYVNAATGTVEETAELRAAWVELAADEAKEGLRQDEDCVEGGQGGGIPNIQVPCGISGSRSLGELEPRGAGA